LLKKELRATEVEVMEDETAVEEAMALSLPLL
jgi:hypothetical protein